MSVPDILKKIIEVKKTEVEALKRRTSREELAEQIASMRPTRDFRKKIISRAEKSGDVALIAEVKKASPSKGVIREDFDPIWIAERYKEGGAACLSILTDRQFFQGELAYLGIIRKVVNLPLLRKDFMIDSLQLYEARTAGADAILLIAACLDPYHLHDLHEEALSLGLDVLVEIHDEMEWEAILSAGAPPPLVGINNRNLRDFTLTLETTERLGPMVTASGSALVAESGIFTRADVTRLKAAGASAILVGESLMKEDDPGEAARKLLATTQ
jgi:indole-3-glycerol phosphate synthase